MGHIFSSLIEADRAKLQKAAKLNIMWLSSFLSHSNSCGFFVYLLLYNPLLYPVHQYFSKTR